MLDAGCKHDVSDEDVSKCMVLGYRRSCPVACAYRNRSEDWCEGYKQGRVDAIAEAIRTLAKENK